MEALVASSEEEQRERERKEEEDRRYKISLPQWEGVEIKMSGTCLLKVQDTQEAEKVSKTIIFLSFSYVKKVGN